MLAADPVKEDSASDDVTESRSDPRAPDPRNLAELDRLLTQLAAVVEVVYVRRPLEGVLEDEDVTAAQLRTLRLLSSEIQTSPGLLVGAISEGLRISYPAATKAVDRLVERGLAERKRDERDARQTLVRLTERGREVVSRVAAERRTKLEAALKALGGELPTRSLATLLEAFVAHSLSDPRDREEVQRETGL
jgi:DNA-binding MarR family transcriptional regulator